MRFNLGFGCGCFIPLVRPIRPCLSVSCVYFTSNPELGLKKARQLFNALFCKIKNINKKTNPFYKFFLSWFKFSYYFAMNCESGAVNYDDRNNNGTIEKIHELHKGT